MAKVEIEAGIKREDDMCVCVRFAIKETMKLKMEIVTELSIERRGKLIDCEAAAWVGGSRRGENRSI